MFTLADTEFDWLFHESLFHIPSKSPFIEPFKTGFNASYGAVYTSY